MSMLSRSRRVRWSVASLALGLFAALGFAQSPTPAPPKAEAEAATPAQKKLDAIIERYDKAEKDWEASMDAAKSEDEASALKEKRPGNDFLDEIEVVAKEAKGTETAAQAWVAYAGIARDLGNVKQVATAVETLVADHVSSPVMARVTGLIMTPRAFKPDRVEHLLRQVMEKSSDKTAQASSMLALGTKLMENKKAERKAEGRALLEKVQKNFADVKPPRGPGYAAIAEGQLFALDNLEVGKAPPDFEVTDENGVKFKLSDYRGKVVVLDFWGIW